MLLSLMIQQHSKQAALLGEVRTHRWGHFCDLALYSLKLLSAGVLTGFDYPSGWLLPHHIATAY